MNGSRFASEFFGGFFCIVFWVWVVGFIVAAVVPPSDAGEWLGFGFVSIGLGTFDGFLGVYDAR